MKLLEKNSAFRTVICSGKYIYIDNHLCLFEEKYLQRDGKNVTRLSEYGRTHLSESCLDVQRFAENKDVDNSTFSTDKIRKKGKKKNDYHNPDLRLFKVRAYRQMRPVSRFRTVSPKLSNQGISADELAVLSKEYNETVRSVRKELPESFHEAFQTVCE